MTTLTATLTRQTVSFESEGETLAGNFYLPPGYSPGTRLPAVVVVGPWTQVKEQTADRYARALAERGFAALTFDARYWGESGGEPRQYESTAKVADTRNAVTYLESRPEVNSVGIGGLAVCFGAGYMARAAAEDDRLRAFATVAAWLHDEASLEATFGEAEVARRWRVGAEAKARYEKSGEVVYVPAYAPGDDPEAGMNFLGGYYASPERGAIPAWTNRFAVISWPEWLGLDGLRAASRVSVPTLFVHSDGSALPDNVRRAHAAMKGPKSLFWTEGSHFDFYNQEPQVTRAANAAASHFAEHLGGGSA